MLSFLKEYNYDQQAHHCRQNQVHIFDIPQTCNLKQNHGK